MRIASAGLAIPTPPLVGAINANNSAEAVHHQNLAAYVDDMATMQQAS